MMIAAYVLSFVGFADLINVLYKFMGVVGMFIVVAVLIKYFKRKMMTRNTLHKLSFRIHFTI